MLGWYFGKFFDRIVSGKLKSMNNNNRNSMESLEQQMKRKRDLMKDYYSEFHKSHGFYFECSILSDLPLFMGWLRKRKP
jgi:hypothetical protein